MSKIDLEELKKLPKRTRKFYKNYIARRNYEKIIKIANCNINNIIIYINKFQQKQDK